jgi:hypothetical protein
MRSNEPKLGSSSNIRLAAVVFVLHVNVAAGLISERWL